MFIIVIGIMFVVTIGYLMRLRRLAVRGAVAGRLGAPHKHTHLINHNNSHKLKILVLIVIVIVIVNNSTIISSNKQHNDIIRRLGACLLLGPAALRQLVGEERRGVLLYLYVIYVYVICV